MSLREDVGSSAENAEIVTRPGITRPQSRGDLGKLCIVHVITELGPGGAERMLLRLVSASTHYRHVVVSLTTEGEIGPLLRSAGVEVVGLRMRRNFPSPLAIVRLARIIRRERPVVVQTWLYHADLVGLAAARLANVGSAVAWNVRCSDMDLSQYRWTTWIAVKFLSLLSSRPDIVMANSEAGCRWHRLIGYHPKGWEIVPNGTDTVKFRPDSEARTRWRQRLNVRDSDVLIGMVARRDPMKDHEGMLRAAAQAAQGRSGLTFVLAGKGVTRADSVLARLADEVGAPVHLIGECDDTAGLNAALDIAVLSSAFGEGFPNVVAEAMATATPCIVTDVGDAAKIIGSTGVAVPTRDPGALADAIATLAGDRPMRTRLGEAARCRIQEHYSLAAAVERYETLWRKLALNSREGFNTGMRPNIRLRKRYGLLRKTLQRGLPIAVTFAALAVVLSRFDLNRLWNTATALRPFTVGLVISALLAGNLLACVRFKIVAGGLHQPVRLRDAFAATSLGQLAGSFFFQVVGQALARSAVLSKAGVSMPTTIIITAYERVIAALVSVALALLGAFYLFGHVSLDLSGGGDELLEIIAGIAFVGFAGALFAWGSKAKQAIRGAEWKHAAATYLRASAVTVLIQMTTLTAYLVAAIGFSPTIPFAQLAAATVLVMLAASVPISFAGWGIREISAVYALGAIGMPKAASVVIALLVGFSSIAVMAATALIGSSLMTAVQSNSRFGARATTAFHSAFLDWTIPVFVASAIFFQIYVPVGAGELNVNLADSAVLFGGALFLRYLMSRKTPLSQNRVRGPGIMVLLMTATIIVAFMHGWIIDGWTAWASTNRMFGWLVLLAYAGTGALLARQKDADGFPILLRTFVFAGLAVSTFELALLLAVAIGAPIPEKLLALRIDGFAQNPNAFGFQLLLVMAGIIALRLKGWRQCAALAITFATLYFTVSRAAEGTWIVVCIASVAFGYLNARSLISSLLVSAIGVGIILNIGYAVMALGSGGPSHFADYAATITHQLTQGDPGHDFSSDRWFSIVGGIQMFLAHPIFGAGLGAFVDIHERQHHEFLIIHSTPIWLLAETGIIGFAAFAVPYVYVLHREIRASLAGHIDSARILLVLSLIAFGVMSQVHDLMYQRAFWFLLGAAIFSGEPATRRQAELAQVATIDEGTAAI